jgi:signal transduction histidine kinase
MVADIGSMVAAVSDPREVYLEVVKCAGTLACGARAVLLFAYEHGTMFVAAEWRADGGDAAPALFSLQGDPSTWSDGIPDAAVRSKIEREHPGFRARARPLRLSTGVDLGAGCVGGVVFILDKAQDEQQPLRATCDDNLADSEALSFLCQIGPIVFGSYTKVFAASIAQRLHTSVEWASDAAETIRKATGADVVLVYHREQGQLRITGTSTGAVALRDLPIAGDSLTERCTAELRQVLIPDVENPSDPEIAHLHRDSLKRISTALEWPGIRSWYCHPVVADTRSSGVVKILTRSGGRFLDPSCVEVVTAVTAHVASEFERRFRTDMLDGLNEVSTRLSGKEGSALAKELIEEFERWAHKFIQADCHVAVIAAVSSQQASLFAANEAFDAASFEKANASELDALTTTPLQHRWRELPSFTLPDSFRSHHQLAVPISLNSNTLLRGCVLVIASNPLGRRERTATTEAAREISILLDYEQRRHLRVVEGARFRHALLGPVQGVMNQADVLNRLVKHGQVTADQLRDVAARISSEANAIGLWRDIQRLYASKEVRIVKRTQALRPIVERCVDRYREPIRVERSSQLELSFRASGSLDIPVDEPAIDLVLTNLLDNARKYCFAHTIVTVIVESLRSTVRVAVEDIGHGIPRRLETRIYQVGERLDWEDRVRSIDGTGLGLPISLALVEAHGGRLYHECTEGISTSDVNRCRVRFTMELPSRWRT